jgi:hypothetical protein
MGRVVLMPSVSVQWWGAVIGLDRSEGCFAATGVPEAGALILATVPQPYGAAVAAAVVIHKAWIGSQMGTEGVDLHLNWAGFVHWVQRRGDPMACEGERAVLPGVAAEVEAEVQAEPDYATTS